jgi:hypothetical protein
VSAPFAFDRRHAAGLGLAAAIVAILVLFWVELPGWLDRLGLGDLALLAFALAAALVLQIGEMAWTRYGAPPSAH